MSDKTSQQKPTIWTATASPVPVASKLDMTVPPSNPVAARRRAAKTDRRLESKLASYAPRSTAEAPRKLVK